MGEEVFSSSISEAFRRMFKRHDETDKKIDHLTDLVTAWPATCAEHRLELERRIANGKGVAPVKQNGNGRSIKVGGYSVKLQTVVGAVVLAGMMLMGALLVIGIVLVKYGPTIAQIIG
jgi:hypothetical protein